MRQDNLTSRSGWQITAAAGFSAILAIALPAHVRAATLTDWQFDPTSSQLTFSLDRGTTPTYYTTANPPRIIIELPQTAIGSGNREQRYPGAVRQISVLSQPAGGTQIVLELAPEIALSPQQVQLQKVTTRGAYDSWILSPSILNAPAPVVATPPTNPTEMASPIPRIEFGQPLPFPDSGN